MDYVSQKQYNSISFTVTEANPYPPSIVRGLDEGDLRAAENEAFHYGRNMPTVKSVVDKWKHDVIDSIDPEKFCKACEKAVEADYKDVPVDHKFVKYLKDHPDVDRYDLYNSKEGDRALTFYEKNPEAIFRVTGRFSPTVEEAMDEMLCRKLSDVYEGKPYGVTSTMDLPHPAIDENINVRQAQEMIGKAVDDIQNALSINYNKELDRLEIGPGTIDYIPSNSISIDPHVHNIYISPNIKQIDSKAFEIKGYTSIDLPSDIRLAPHALDNRMPGGVKFSPIKIDGKDVTNEVAMIGREFKTLPYDERLSLSQRDYPTLALVVTDKMQKHGIQINRAEARSAARQISGSIEPEEAMEKCHHFFERRKPLEATAPVPEKHRLFDRFRNDRER